MPCTTCVPCLVAGSALYAAEQGEGAASSSAPQLDASRAKLSDSIPTALDADAPEELYYEGSGSPAELALSLLLGFTLIYAPLTMASIGRRLWIKYRFTNKRLTVTNTSPFFKNEVCVAHGFPSSLA